QGQLASVNTSYAARDTAFNAAKGATQNRDAAYSAAIETIAGWSNQWQAQGIDPQILSDLGLIVHDTTPTTKPVFTPSGMTVTLFADGTNWVRWERNGNEYGIKFDLEVAYDGSNDWQAVTTVTAKSYKHMNQTPGREVVYRVRARNGNNVSGWLTSSSYYEGSPSLQVA
ncbi:MAG TPA: fibronectin type III domain-containing protein, partial [Fimbriimonadaceae bacterium]|nr:fibronectin type III domain-containing protein [Fimbriimonadaceae bacterium]